MECKTLYVVADVLTIARFLIALLMFLLIVFSMATPKAILTLLVIGELTDALDGSVARRAREIEEFECLMARAGWHYLEPLSDGKRGFWVIFDQVADVALVVATTLFLVLQIDATTKLRLWVIVILGIFAFMAVMIQVVRAAQIERYGRVLDDFMPYILGRRYLYLVLLAGEIVSLVMLLNCDFVVKLSLLAIGLAIGLVLLLIKRNRLVEDKTPM